MRINNMSNVSSVYKATKVKKAYKQNSGQGPKDSVSLSSFAKELSVAKRAIDSTPDVRQEKVSAIKQQIKEGTYDVSAEQVAEKILANS